jgi:proline iminopeptidase
MGTSAGTVEQDIEVAEAAIGAIEPSDPIGICRGYKLQAFRLIPVVGGKYKVWTKGIGMGDVKVLLLHGGPGGRL